MEKRIAELVIDSSSLSDYRKGVVDGMNLAIQSFHEYKTDIGRDFYFEGSSVLNTAIKEIAEAAVDNARERADYFMKGMIAGFLVSKEGSGSD